MCDSRVILNNIVQLKGGGKSDIHFSTVGRMTGKHRYFCETDVFQHVLSKVVLYLVFLICDIFFGCEDKRRIWLMIKSHLWWPFLCFRKTVNIWVHAHKDNIFCLRNSARIYIQNQGSGRHILEQFFEIPK